MRLHEENIINAYHYYVLKKLSNKKQIEYVYKWLYSDLVQYAGFLVRTKYKIGMEINDLINIYMFNIPKIIKKYNIKNKNRINLKEYLILEMISNMLNTCRGFFRKSNWFNYNLVSYNDELTTRSEDLNVKNEYFWSINYKKLEKEYFLDLVNQFNKLEKTIILYLLKGLKKKEIILKLGATTTKINGAFDNIIKKLKREWFF
ncbi:hypothetical protein [Mycoplasma elephantis]|uniref:hypothetical protein n=1 Tax=Mycoplasma elephantis TaxID=114882 RepID=UPI00048471E8|nr:hypothetical protein [Mycoplasma elephantis]